MTCIRSMKINWCLFFLLWVFGVGSGQANNRDEVIFFFNDAQGSAIAAVNESGELCWSEEYTGYGDKNINDDVFSEVGCGIVGEERGFTGHTEDANSDLVYMQQRYYDPSIGRFLSIDPIEADPHQPMTFNRYAYANNNPYKYTDPDGRLPVLIPVAAFLAKEIAAEVASRATNGVTDFLSARRVAGKAVEVAGKVVAKLAGKNKTDVANQAGGSIRNVNKVGGKQNCANCAIATDATLAGNPASALNGGKTLVTDVEKHFGRKFGSLASQTRIADRIGDAGNGARGVVFGSRGSATGHFFNVVNQNGTVRFLDGQTGAAADLSGFQGFSLLRTN